MFTGLSILGIFNFFKTNIKWIAIILVSLIITFGLWRYTRLVENYALAQQTIEQQQQIIRDKEKQIIKERELNALSNSIIEEQAKELANIQSSLDNITNNLPDDSKELAPESIRETIRRLRNIK